MRSYEVDHIIYERSSQVLIYLMIKWLDGGWMLVWHHRQGDEMESAQGKGIFVGNFVSLVKDCIEMCLTGLR